MPFDRTPEVQALLDATVDAVMVIDAHGLVAVFNRSAERLFGYDSAEVVGRNVNILMTDRDRGSHDAYMQRYMTTHVPHIIGIGREVDARRRDGSVFPVFLSVGQIPGSEPPRFVGFLHDITLRRETMAAIRRERDRANMYLEVAQVILVALSADGRVQLINHKGCATLGRREVELLGRDWLECAVPEEERTRVLGYLRRLADADAERELYFEHDVVAPDGTRRLVAWRCIRLQNSSGRLVGYLSSGEDITARRAIEQSMARTRRLLNEAQEIANLGNFEVYLPTASEDFWSPQLYRILQVDPNRERMSVEKFIGLMHPDDRERCLAEWNLALSAPGAYTSEYRTLTPGGEVRNVRSNYQASEKSHGRVRVVGTILDITDATRAEEAEREAQQRMTHVSRLATMGEMAAGIAHELNQPLAAIANYASAASRLLASSEPDGDDVRHALQQISGQALRAGEIIRRLRSLVQNRETRRETADVNDLVQEVISFSQSDARLHEVRLRTDLASNLPELQVDGIQVQQVLLNLIRNAIEALGAQPAGERDVLVVTALDGEESVTIAVRDNGPGVPSSLETRVFDPFCTTKETGTGLGLAISRTIAEAHQGKLVYEPNTPRGACFMLRLPRTANRGN